MAPPRPEPSQLKRARGSQGDGDSRSESYKKPRRSERISHINDADKTPVSNKHHLPSPVTHQTSEEPEEPEQRFKEGTATPPEGRPSQVHRRNNDDLSYSQKPIAFASPPSDSTQAFPTQVLDPNEPLVKEVEDEVKEGVWGYLFPLDARFGGKCVVMRKRAACPMPNMVTDVVRKRKGKKALSKEEDDFEQTKIKGIPAGGYLIGRHPECDVVIDDPSVSNRHCLLFTEHKGQDTVAIIEDLSSNGTFVNEAIIGRNQRRELQEQDEIAVLDKARFIFKYSRTRHTSAFMQQYTLLEQLGKGHFAEVFLCVEKTTGQRFAVKVFTKTPGMEERSKTDGLQQEIGVLMGVSHPNMLCLKDTFNEKNAVFLVLELAAEGELFNYIVMKQKLTENEARKLFTQLFQGVKYLHERGIVHRDIKPENILMVDKELHVKIADFGLAKIIGEESFTTTLCGTPSYVAPEILAEGRHRKYTKAVDVWSLGVVLYICLCGFPPFSDELYSREFPYSLSQQIRSGRFDYPSPYWDSVGDPALDLIDSMLVVDPEKRFTIDQCLSHPWMTANQAGPNDSTDGMTGKLATLDVNRRSAPQRQRTLLSSINTVEVSKIPGGPKGSDPVKVFDKNPEDKRKQESPNGNESTPANKKSHESRPADARNPEEFVEMGGQGDEVLLMSNDSDSHYPTRDLTATGDDAGGAKGEPSKGKPRNNGKKH